MDHPHVLEEYCPCAQLDSERIPGHWLLARLGKRVLRPGGLELTRKLLAALDIGASDDVIEFAPGLGVTAKMTLARRPASYRAVERDKDAARQVLRILEAHGASCQIGSADDTGLEAASASVVYGEAMLSMQTPQQKERIVAEAARLLRPGGRYGIHELCLHFEDTPADVKAEIFREMSEVVHVGVRPLAVSDWKALLEAQGLEVETVQTAPFHLLEPPRLFQDEGFFGALRFVSRVARDRKARARVLRMRRTFRKHQEHLAALMLIARKPE